MINKNTINKLKEIQKLIDKATDIYNDLESEQRNQVAEYHNDNDSLKYCLRWGEQAAKDIIEEEQSSQRLRRMNDVMEDARATDRMDEQEEDNLIK